jgi:FHA domain-containing protein
MSCMNEKHIAQLEARLEELVESAFTNLFRKTVSAHDIAMKLARSMESNLRYVQDADSRPIAPDNYAIHLHPDIQNELQRNLPKLAQILHSHIVDLVSQSEYRLSGNPIVSLIANHDIKAGELDIVATHSQEGDNSTQAMQPILIEQEAKPIKPQLVINGTRTISLIQPLLNIGRGADNHIVLDDTFVSRHHIQLRLRFGMYMLFDVNSRSGTYVNNVLIKEHPLQAGDVIRIGNTQIIYLIEDDKSGMAPSTTQSLDPIDT